MITGVEEYRGIIRGVYEMHAQILILLNGIDGSELTDPAQVRRQIYSKIQNLDLVTIIDRLVRP